MVGIGDFLEQGDGIDGGSVGQRVDGRRDDGLVAPHLDQSLDETPGYDVDPSAAANRGAWESSGIVDASSIWGPGWFLIDVQAGSLILEREDGMLGDRPVTFEREGGQLLRVKIPGA